MGYPCSKTHTTMGVKTATRTHMGEWTGTKEHSTQCSTYMQASLTAPGKERGRDPQGAMGVLLADWVLVTRELSALYMIWVFSSLNVTLESQKYIRKTSLWVVHLPS